MALFRSQVHKHYSCYLIMLPYTTLMLVLLLSLATGMNPEREINFDRKNYISSTPNKLELLEKQSQLISNLEAYADKIQEKIDTMKSLVVKIRKPLQAAKGNEEEYLSNPLHSYPLIRHMHADWTLLEEFMQAPVGQEQIDFLNEMRAGLPVLDDLEEAAEFFYRIQVTYGLEPKHMARGLLHGVQYNASLSPLDCFIMGVFCYQNTEYKDAEQWLATSLELLQTVDRSFYEFLGLERRVLSQFYAYTLLAQEREADALAVFEEEPLLQPAATRIVEQFKREPPVHGPENDYLKERYENTKEYKLLCRGDFKPRNTRLQCRYNTTTVPFLRLAPFKMEQLSVDPYVVLYHDVLSPYETAEIARLSEPSLKRSIVFNYDYNVDTVSRSRTGEGTWIPNENHSSQEYAFIMGITQRVGDLSGLLMNDNHNSIQVLNYGFGGHYVPHHDYFNDSSRVTEIGGDRIATALFYLNDVPLGGATVFPKLDLTVSARRGKVLYWHNMKGDSLDFDVATFHGACPVIVGKKLAMTRWIHVNEQMFIQPCRDAASRA